MKIRGARGKHVPRRVLARYVPSALFERPKQGFAVPIDQWLRGELRPWAEDLLSEQRLKIQDLFNPPEVRRIWAQHLSGATNGDVRLWRLLRSCPIAWCNSRHRGHRDLRRAGIDQAVRIGRLTMGLSLSPATDSRLK